MSLKVRKSIKYFIFSFLLLGLVSSPFLFESSQRDVASVNEEEAYKEGEGPIFYPASYPTVVTNEPNYSTQKTLTLDPATFNNVPTYYRGDKVKVAVIDSGIKYLHEDFRANNESILNDNSGTCYSSTGIYKFSTYPTKIDDTLGHGSNVASTVASQINSLGSLGIAPNVDLYVYKVTNTNNGYVWDYIKKALTECINNEVDVVNMSFQAYEHEVSYGGQTMAASTGCSTVLQSKLNECYNAGITLVGAAGNFNTEERSYPASNDHVISVGSLSRASTTTKAGYSNLTDIDIVAPGSVYVANNGSTSDYKETQGTSFSAPIVTAAIALYKQKFPNATPAQIESALYASCDSISGNPSWAGHGRLNIDRFLNVERDFPTEIVINNPEVVDDYLELKIGDELSLNLTINGVGNYDHNVTYSLESDNGVISVDSSGKITALSVGEEILTISSASDPGILAVIFISVDFAPETPKLSSISISGQKTSLPLNSEFSFGGTVTAHYDNGSTKDVTNSSTKTGYDMSQQGNQTVTITYKENGITKTTSYTLNVYKQDESLVDLEHGTFSTDHITWQTVDGHTTVVQTKGNGSNAVSSSYISAPRVYKGHILSFTAATGYKIASIELKCDGTYYGNSMTAGISLNGTTVTNDTTNVARTWATGQSGTHVVSSVSSGGLATIYIQNVSTTNTQLRLTQILIKYAVPKSVTRISVKTPPTKLNYEVNEYFDPTSLVITVTYDDSSTADISYAGHTNEFTFDPTLTTKLTKSHTSVTITYANKLTSQAITVKDAVTLTSINVTNPKTSFVEGDAFSFGEGTVTANFSDGSHNLVTNDATFTGYVMTTVSSQTVTVHYTYKNVERTATYQISVAQGTPSSLSVSGQTTTYTKGQAFSFDGTCTVTFANGYLKTVTPTSVSSPDMTTAGQKTITVSFTYNNKTVSTTYQITVNAYRKVEEYQYTTIGSIVYTSGIEVITTGSGLSTSKSGYTTIENAPDDSHKGLRLGSGSNTGKVTVNSTSANIYRIVVNARVYRTDSGVNFSIGGTAVTLTQTYKNFSKDYSTATNSIELYASTNGKRVWISSITVYTRSLVDISETSDCVGLESFITQNMHMDYVDNLGYCKDETHHYYATAKAAFNLLNEHQRSLFTTNSAYLAEWTRLSTWASKNGDSLNSSNLLDRSINTNPIILGTKENSKNIIMIAAGLTMSLVAIAGYYFIRKRRTK